MSRKGIVNIDGRAVPINGERNLLELCRKAGVDIPTFCYHSDLSVYGACRLCLVDVAGRGIVTSCSTTPEPGMTVNTRTAEIQRIRRIAVELLLADHDQRCPTCPKSGACQLQALARRLGVETVRFKPTHSPEPVDRSSPSLVRDPNKCVLCGDCVRACAEIQGIGAIDIVGRGAASAVKPAFGRNLGQVECVGCGLCASVCPTGALTPRTSVPEVWAALDNPAKTVVAQVAPAVRVAIGEAFGLAPGPVTTGQIVAALKALGFRQVYDTAFTADLTVLEETTEFLGRVKNGGSLPLFTSCCPAWVRFAEQYYPELLPHLSSCRSPQQMLGALAKGTLPGQMGVDERDLVMVSIMPCTAKKAECLRPEFRARGRPDVDHVLTTQELARMIEERGLRFRDLEPESMDQPFGFKTGAGVIFGASGGVTEAVLRYAAEVLGGVRLRAVEFRAVRGESGLRMAEIAAGERTVRVAMVHGLARARQVAERVRAGDFQADLIEVMACPGGCIGGAGQPVTSQHDARQRRAQGLYDADRMLDFHTAQENHMVGACYREHLGDIGGEQAHYLLHTEYTSRKRIAGTPLELMAGGNGARKLKVSVCLGTNCMVRGSQQLIRDLGQLIEERGLQDTVELTATFCLERCDRGPGVSIDGMVLHRCTLATVAAAIEKKLQSAGIAGQATMVDALHAVGPGADQTMGSAHP